MLVDVMLGWVALQHAGDFVAQFAARREGERSDPTPVRRCEFLHDEATLAVRNAQRLPAVGVVQLIRRVDWLVVRRVSVVVLLVRSVIAPSVQHPLCGEVADRARRYFTGGGVVGIVAEAPHQIVERRLLCWEEIYK